MEVTMKIEKTLKRIAPLWLLVLLGAGIAAGAVLYTYVSTTFTVTVANLNVTATLENTNFLVPDNGSTSVKYTVTNSSGENKTLTVLSNVPDNTNNKLFFNCYYPWPNGTNKVNVDGVNYGFTLNNGTSENLKVVIGDSSATLNENWSTLQLYLMDNALA